MKHKYAEVVHAFLDGKQCEGWNYQTKDWYEITRLGSFDYCDDARIKAETNKTGIFCSLNVYVHISSYSFSM